MKNNGLKQVAFDTQHAVVIGGSMAGLLTARVLSEHFERVTIIERDQLADDAEPRKGVPQGRHVHGLLAGGAALIGTYFPDLFATLTRDGSVPVGGTEIRRYQLDSWVAPVPGPVKALWQSRPFLEQHVRASLLTRGNIQIMDNCEATRLMMHNGRVIGVFVRQRTGEQREDELPANLVVDACGRGSRAAQWLASSGYGQVKETNVRIDVGYASRIYRCPEQLPADWKTLIIMGTPPEQKRSGVIFPIEGGRWMVTLGGWIRDYPPEDDAGFLEFARSLVRPELYDAIKEAEPLSSIVVYKYTANRWRHFEQMARLPEGFIVMGDAVCNFSPVYGQGMAVAAVEARTLDAYLREQNFSGFSLRFQKAIAKEIQLPWLLSTGEDLRYPEAEGPRPLSTRLFTWYMRHVVNLTTTDPRMALAFFQVWHLLKSPKVLLAPHIVRAVVKRELATRRR